jgi:hypothetical protein
VKDAKIRAAVASAVVALLAPSTAGAEGGPVWPPFDDARAQHSCGVLFVHFEGSTLEGCSADASAEIDGAMSLQLAVESPYGGTLPGAPVADGTARLSATHEMPAASKVRYRLVAEIVEAEASTTGRIDTQSWDFQNYAELDLDVYVSETSGGVGYPVVDDAEFFAPSIRHGETIVGELDLEAPEGEVLEGVVEIEVSLWGDASLGNPAVDTGSSRVDVELRITELSYVIIS